MAIVLKQPQARGSFSFALNPHHRADIMKRTYSFDEILAERSPEQRQAIERRYEEMYADLMASLGAPGAAGGSILAAGQTPAGLGP